jgi:hypothetical protein
VTCANGQPTVRPVTRRPRPYRPVPRSLASGGGNVEGSPGRHPTRTPHRCDRQRRVRVGGADWATGPIGVHHTGGGVGACRASDSPTSHRTSPGHHTARKALRWRASRRWRGAREGRHRAREGHSWGRTWAEPGFCSSYFALKNLRSKWPLRRCCWPSRSCSGGERAPRSPRRPRAPSISCTRSDRARSSARPLDGCDLHRGDRRQRQQPAVLARPCG